MNFLFSSGEDSLPSAYLYKDCQHSSITLQTWNFCWLKCSVNIVGKPESDRKNVSPVVVDQEKQEESRKDDLVVLVIYSPGVEL